MSDSLEQQFEAWWAERHATKNTLREAMRFAFFAGAAAGQPALPSREQIADAVAGALHNTGVEGRSFPYARWDECGSKFKTAALEWKETRAITDAVLALLDRAGGRPGPLASKGPDGDE